MINCKIISVNIEDVDTSNNVQDFVHQKNEMGNKIRYINRRKKIKEFIENENVDGIKNNFCIFKKIL